MQHALWAKSFWVFSPVLQPLEFFLNRGGVWYTRVKLDLSQKKSRNYTLLFKMFAHTQEMPYLCIVNRIIKHYAIYSISINSV